MSHYTTIRQKVGSRAGLSVARKSSAVTESVSKTTIINSAYKQSVESRHGITRNVQIVGTTQVETTSTKDFKHIETNAASSSEQSTSNLEDKELIVIGANNLNKEVTYNSASFAEAGLDNETVKSPPVSSLAENTLVRNKAVTTSGEHHTEETEISNVKVTSEVKENSSNTNTSDNKAPKKRRGRKRTPVILEEGAATKNLKDIPVKTIQQAVKSTSSRRVETKEGAASGSQEISAENSETANSETATLEKKFNESTSFSLMNSVLSYFTKSKTTELSDSFRYNLRSRNVSDNASNSQENIVNATTNVEDVQVNLSTSTSEVAIEVGKINESSDRVIEVSTSCNIPTIEIIKRKLPVDRIFEKTDKKGTKTVKGITKRKRTAVKTELPRRTVRHRRKKSLSTAETDVNSMGKAIKELETRSILETAQSEGSVLHSDLRSDGNWKQSEKIKRSIISLTSENTNVENMEIECKDVDVTTKKIAPKRKNLVRSEDLNPAKRAATQATDDREDGKEKSSYFGSWSIISRFTDKGGSEPSENNASQSFSFVDSVMSYFTKRKTEESLDSDNIRYNLRNRRISGSPIPASVHYSYSSEAKHWSPRRKRKSRAGSGRSSPIVKRRRTKKRLSGTLGEDSKISARDDLQDSTEDELVALAQSSDEEKPGPSGLVLPTTPKRVPSPMPRDILTAPARKPRKKRVSFSGKVETSDGPPHKQFHYKKQTPGPDVIRAMHGHDSTTLRSQRTKQTGQTTDRQILPTNTLQTGYDGN